MMAACIGKESEEYKVLIGAEDDINRAGKSGVDSALATTEYIRREFPNLTGQDPECYSVPPHFVRNDGSRDDQKAEVKVVVQLKKISNKNIPGLGMIYFHGRHYAGVKSGMQLSPRELDFAVFTTFKGRHKTIFFEVKSCHDDMETKKVNENRKKANSQLQDHKRILKNELNIDADKIRCHTLWPFLSSTETKVCDSCKVKHARFKKPKSCKKSVQNQPKDEDGKHIFKNAFSGAGEEFQKWFLSLLDDPDDNKYVQDKSDWMKLIGKFVQLSCGALFDEMEKNFVLLGTDQLKLVSLPAHDLSSPRIISGTAGTGKTLTTIAKIIELYQDGKITNDEKAIYICSSDEVIKYVEGSLKKIKADLKNIMFTNWRNNSSKEGFWNSEEDFKEIAANYSYIFFDEAEDIGIWKLNECVKFFENQSKRKIGKLGHFWILYDPLQNGSCYKRIQLFPPNCMRLKLNTVFRSARNCHMYLKNDVMTQMYDPKDSLGHSIDGLRQDIKHDLTEYNEKFNGDADKFLKSYDFKLKVLQAVSNFVVDKCSSKGVHPGDIAITYDDYHHDIITKSCGSIQDPESTMTESLCKITKNKFANKNHLDHGIPLATTSIDESLLFSHDVEAVKCRCKYFIGPYTKIKGLSSKVVAFVSINGDRIGRNRLASYVSLSRSTCAIAMLDFYIPFLDMDKFLFNSLKFQERRNEASIKNGFAITKFTCSGIDEYGKTVQFLTSEREKYEESNSFEFKYSKSQIFPELEVIEYSWFQS